VFFASPNSGQGTRIYVRVDDERTLEVSRVRGGAGAAAKILFRGASRDGNRALLLARQGLLPAAGQSPAESDPNAHEDPYLWSYDSSDPDNDSPRALTRLTGLPQVGPGPLADGQIAMSIVGTSDDLSRVYFTTRPAAGVGEPSQANLYAATLPADDPHRGTIQFVATYFTDTMPPIQQNAGYSGCMNAASEGSLDFASVTNARCADSSRNGRYLAFTSRLPLTADDRDSDGVDTCAPPVATAIPAYCRVDVYVYDLIEETLMRASRGVAPLTGDGQVDARFEVLKQNLSVTDAGLVYFSTDEGLAEGDVNGQRDVYEFDAASGAVTLMSGGKGPDNSLFVGVSGGGDSVFFFTTEDLAPDDTDFSGDFYVYRRGGGFPDTRRLCDPAVADDCQGAQTRPPAPPTETGTPPSVGNDSPGARPRLSVATLSPKARKRAARTGRLAIRVRVSKAGRVGVVARARVKSGRKRARSRRVARGSVRARHAGPVTVRIRLNRAARRQLVSRALRVNLKVSFGGLTRSRSVSLPRVR
jgi:hypothetical protein